MGLWLVQECRRTWRAQGEDLTYDEITRLAAEAQPFLAVIDPDDDLFSPPRRDAGKNPQVLRRERPARSADEG